MDYLLSKYNYFKIHEDVVVGVNLFKKNLFALERNKYELLMKFKDDLVKLSLEYPVFFSTMYKLGIINETGFDNVIPEMALFGNRKKIFSPDKYVLMILPTLNCNFNCWYCYETRQKKIMSKEIVDSMIKFIQNQTNKKTDLVIQWYGGEPLLCYETVKLISEKAKKSCEKNKVNLLSTITTNGYLLKKEMLPVFKNANMQSFQITLNGPRNIHNITRYQKNTTDSYEKIVENIIMLAEELDPEHLILRINFEKKYFESITDIIDSFPMDIRKKINVLIKQIDQDSEKASYKEIMEKLSIFNHAGFNIEAKNMCYMKPNYYVCEADLYSQAIINYDGRVFKCHANDFMKEEEEGILTKEGNIKWNEKIIAKNMNKATFDNEICLSCKLLHICYGGCSYRQNYIKHLNEENNGKCVLFNDIEENLYHVMDTFKKSGKGLAYILNYQ